MAVLRELEGLASPSAAASAAPAEAAEAWRGLAFTVHPWPLVAPARQVQEVLDGPRLSRVPGARPWLRGVTQVRGRILAVTDLQGFLSGTAAAAVAERVLVVEDGELFAGLAVSTVLGFRSFGSAQALATLPDTPAWLRPYLSGAFTDGGSQLAVIDLHTVLRRPEFLHAAA